jgi:DNA modification methylase
VKRFIFPPTPAPSKEWALWRGDTLEVLSFLPDNQARCIITSPPYFHKFDYGCEAQCGHEGSIEEYVEYQTSVAQELLRVATEDANFFFIIQDSFNGSGGTGGDFNTADGHCKVSPVRGAQIKDYPRKAQLLIPERLRIAFANVGWIPILKIVWDKMDPRRAAKDRPSYSYEEVHVYAASPNHYWNRSGVLAPFRSTSLGQLDKPFNSTSNAGYGLENPCDTKRSIIKSMQKREGAYLRAVWAIPSGSQPVVSVNGDQVRGIASFPLMLAEICVLLGSAPGDAVLDPYSGMGTTLLAALKLGREAIGIELSETYIRASQVRIQEFLKEG